MEEEDVMALPGPPEDATEDVAQADQATSVADFGILAAAKEEHIAVAQMEGPTTIRVTYKRRLADAALV
jgi:hypothetical protein